MNQAIRETNTNPYPKGLAIGYCRVSTALQETEGYSMEAQEGMIKEFCARNGYELLDTYTEQESGRKSDRDIVNKVVNLCSSKKATLIIARLDRFTRDLHFLTTVQKRQGFKFVAIDNPSADKLVIQIMVSIAENESNIISKRTKSALAVAKAKGIQLGNHQSIISNYHRLEKRGGELWELFVEVRNAWNKTVVEHEDYSEFIKWITPCYDVVDTKWGWQEYIRKPISKLWGVTTDYELEGDFWDATFDQLEPDKSFGGKLNRRTYLKHISDNFGIYTGETTDNRYPIKFPKLDADKKPEDEITLDAFKLKVNDADILIIWRTMASLNTKLATEARVETARNNAIETYKPYIDEAREEGIEGVRALGRYLESERVPTPKGNEVWAPSSVESILRQIDAYEAKSPLTDKYDEDKLESKWSDDSIWTNEKTLNYWDFIRTGKSNKWVNNRDSIYNETYSLKS